MKNSEKTNNKKKTNKTNNKKKTNKTNNKKKTNKWVMFVKIIQKENPKLSYKQCMILASKTKKRMNNI